jgi:undecaprenyl diphosphate synthase
MNSVVIDEVKANPDLFSSAEVALVQEGTVPHHIAIVMDGNRRWAKKRGMPSVYGHWRGAEVITKIVRAASELGVKVLTLYSFSTENWTRPQEEIDELMKIFTCYLKRQKQFMIDEGVRLGAIGDLSRMPRSVIDALEETMQATASGSKIHLVLAINYGGRDDIRRACIQIVKEVEDGKLNHTEISEELFAKYLDTAKWGDPDLFIRTSGELRLSNFLLWQLSYSEVYITKVLWPDFDKNNLLEAILEYQARERRLGGA